MTLLSEPPSAATPPTAVGPAASVAGPSLPRHATATPAAKRAGVWATVIILLGATAFLLVRLGHYAPWDDEAITIMTARNLWRTGDTTAFPDSHNLIAYRDGLLLHHLKDRFTPPLQFFLLAPVIGLLGDGNFACRLPFALCGLISTGILLRWFWRVRPSPLVWAAAVVALLGNAEFFLYFRQCRYYGLAMLFTLAAGYLYWHLGRRRRGVVALSAVLALLLASQYLCYGAAIACLCLDYAIWGRHRRRLSWGDWLVLIVPQIIVGGIVCSIWSPLHAHGQEYGPPPWWRGHLILLWWYWRDMIASDYVIVPLLLLCPFLYLVRRCDALLRAPLALVVYVGVIAVLSVAPQEGATNAEIRYLAPLLPLCIGIAVLAVWAMQSLTPKLQATMLGLAAASMIIQPAPGGGSVSFIPTSIAFAHELIHPQTEPYTPTIAWVNAHVPAGQSVLVQPAWMCYPLMLRASKAVYAWQLKDPPTSPDYAHLPDIHFRGRVAPDWMIAFGPFTKEVGLAQAELAPRGVRYQRVATIDVFWKDLYRPERLWRSFRTAVPKEGEMVYIYRRVLP